MSRNTNQEKRRFGLGERKNDCWKEDRFQSGKGKFGLGEMEKKLLERQMGTYVPILLLNHQSFPLKSLLRF